MDLEILKKQLTEDEGCKYEIYLDHLGYKTFGIGHLCVATDPENDLILNHLYLKRKYYCLTKKLHL